VVFGDLVWWVSAIFGLVIAGGLVRPKIPPLPSANREDVLDRSIFGGLVWWLPIVLSGGFCLFDDPVLWVSAIFDLAIAGGLVWWFEVFC
jgi:hypothetical protein